MIGEISPYIVYISGCSFPKEFETVMFLQKWLARCTTLLPFYMVKRKRKMMLTIRNVRRDCRSGKGNIVTKKLNTASESQISC